MPVNKRKTVAETSRIIQERLPELRCSVEPDDLAHYGRDWTRQREPAPSLIVWPRSTEEVSALVALANELAIPLVPSGGRTGLSGGAVAADGEVVVSLERMNQILEFDPVDRQMRVQAGVITEQIQRAAEEHGLFYPVDFASAGSSQIGGNLATNAGGIKVFRYGLSRQWVDGLVVVTGRGETLSLNQGLIKNATGYDLRHLFVGSEGTLGIIVEATLRLAPKPPLQAVLVVGTPDMASVMQVLERFRTSVTLSAFEMFSERALAKVVAHTDARRPFETMSSHYVLMEFDAPDERAETEALSTFEACMESGLVVDGVISQSETQAAELWRLREDISETIARYTPYKNDLSVRVSKVPDFMADLDRIVSDRYPDFEVLWYGHIADGNLHLNVLKPEDMPPGDFQAACEQVNELVFQAVKRYDGSVSAEHGVGTLKRPYLPYSRSPEEIEYLRRLKSVFDPKGIMNPGKLVPT